MGGQKWEDRLMDFVLRALARVGWIVTTALHGAAEEDAEELVQVG